MSGAWGTLDRRDLHAIKYWLHHKVGAQFIAVDGSSAPRDQQNPSDPVGDLQKFAAIDAWLGRHTSLPIWWSEVYAGLPTGVAETSQESVLFYTAAGMVLAHTGAARALFWDPEQTANSTTPGVFTNLSAADGGDPTAFATSLAALNTVSSAKSAHLSRGPNVWRYSSSKGTLVANLSSQTTSYSASHQTGELAAWQSRLIKP